MIRLELIAKAEQPLLVTSGISGRGNLETSEIFVPGASLRGALAAELAALIGEDDPFFRKTILQEAMSCGPLMLFDGTPANGGAGPMPRSIRHCKTHNSGLMDHFVLPLPVPIPGLDLARWDKALKGMFCQGKNKTCKFVTPKGSLQWQASAGTIHAQCMRGHHRLLTGTGIDSRIGSVREGVLFSLSPLSEGSLFKGSILIPDDVDPTILMGIKRVRVGVGKTRGMGKLSLSWRQLDNQQWLHATQAKRLDAMQQRYAQELGLSGDRYLVSLDLESPLLLSDALMNDRFVLEARDFAVYDPDLEWQILPAQAQLTVVGGFYAFSAKPKPHRRALAAGSVLPVLVRGPRQKVLAALDAMESHGLGDGWGDGFGRLIVNHPIHIHPLGGH